MTEQTKQTFDPQLDCMVPLSTTKTDALSAERITSLSSDTIRANYADMVIKVSPRREAISVRNALRIASGEAARKL
jgi:hypothetical protein